MPTKVVMKKKRKLALEKAKKHLEKITTLREIERIFDEHYFRNNIEYKQGDYIETFNEIDPDIVYFQDFYTSARLNESYILEYYIKNNWWPSHLVRKVEVLKDA